MGDVLARALGHAKKTDYAESHQVLEQGVGAELGMPFAMLMRLDAASAARLLGRDKAALFAEALRTRALLFKLAGREEEARASEAHAGAVAEAVGPLAGF
jgi:hypothetical protein